MTANEPAPGGGRPVVVGLFEREPQARQAVEAVRSLGVEAQQVGLLARGERPSVSQPPSGDVSGLLAVAASATDGNDVAAVLVDMGVPEGEARFYAEQTREGRTLVVVRAGPRSDQVRQLVLDHGGYDVQSRGGALIRAGSAGVPGGAGPRPVDVTGHWQDFRSRYQMLWAQHYGTSDATWEQMEPVYRQAWELANDPRYRGRPWSEVESAVRRDWEASSLGTSVAWGEAAGPVQDVWQDVAEEAATGHEGGADRRIPRQGTEQTIAARDVVQPDQGAG